MKRFLLLIPILFLTFQSSARSQLLISGDIRGEIEPCGCSARGVLGGIKRTSTFLKHKMKNGESVIWLDLGNFSAESSPQGLLKSELLVKNFTQMNLSAILPGHREFSRGNLNFKEFSLPYVLTNSEIDLPHTVPFRKVGKFVIYGYLTKKILEKGTHKTKLLTPLHSFLQKIKTLKKMPYKSFSILLFRGSNSELEKIAQATIFDLIIPANPAENEENQLLEFKLDRFIFHTPPLKGQGFLEVNFNLQQSVFTTVWLDKKIVEDNSWSSDFKQYRKRVDRLFLQFIERQNSSSYKTVYNGAEYCIDCHQKEGAVWKKSQHAQAWKTLEKVERIYDPECISCHSVGFKNGGFLSPDLTPHLSDVQCESCHGITPPHDENDSLKNRSKVTKSTCKQCHLGAHSPDFDFKSYWQKIRH